MRKLGLLFLLLFLPALSFAQIYKYIGVEDGLSDRRVYGIQKDRKEYMWFLTSDGVNRYNGREFKLYQLTDDGKSVNSQMSLNWLCMSNGGKLIEIGRQGHVFCYDDKRDRFDLVYKLPESAVRGKQNPVSCGYVDDKERVWLCYKEGIYLFDTEIRNVSILKKQNQKDIYSVAQVDSCHYFVGTDTGVYYALLQDDNLVHVASPALDSLVIPLVNSLHYHRASGTLLVGTERRGLFIYDLSAGRLVPAGEELQDIGINCIRTLSDTEVLVATDGMGIYKLDTGTHEAVPYIMADYDSSNGMNGNTVYDLYVDGQQRIWMANYPIGITVRNNRYASYKWIKHAVGNSQSLINDEVNNILEDGDGDLWFATNNGVSLYETRTGRWHSFLHESDPGHPNRNRIFISLCEVAPGVVWAGGYSSGIYEIRKSQRNVNYFRPSLFGNLNIRPDRYIRSIVRTGDGKIWSGGYYNLKEIDYVNKSVRYFPGLDGITSIVEMDSAHLWIGCADGLHLLEKSSGKSRRVSLPVESSYIHALYQDNDGHLYIGMNVGLLVYDLRDKTFVHYHKDNCALISNNIYTILSDGGKDIFLGTENSISIYTPAGNSFHNWTEEQGLIANHFNSDAGTICRNGQVIMGTMNGAVEFDKSMQLPRDIRFKMVFSDLRIFYQIVYPEDEGSPLKVAIDETDVLRLEHDQNIFSLQVSTINYDYPSLILYSWKLEGFYDEWSRPSQENIIRFTNLNPGKYTLRVRAISSEDRRIILEERSMDIVIERPFWLSIWAWMLYLLLALAVAIGIFRYILLQRQRKASDEKIRFFVNTAHDIRTPLTLIKAPLEEMMTRGELGEKSREDMDMAMRNVNSLLRMTTNLINFERIDVYSTHLHVSRYELNSYLEELVGTFRSFAEAKRITLSYTSDFRYFDVWMDKDKMDSILKNILSNAVKYTRQEGSVSVVASATESHWSVEVQDDGIGVPASEQKKMFKIHFRGSNAVNSKVTGSGIGLLLVRKLVRIHKGRLSFSSTEGKGTTVKVVFPCGKQRYRKALMPAGEQRDPFVYPTVAPSPAAVGKPQEGGGKEVADEEKKRQKLLFVEDNDELREYIRNSLKDEYDVQVCRNGKAALTVTKEYMPDLIVSDVMMPEMRGDEMAHILKTDIETSHIPIILLTALATDQDIINGLGTGADDYLTKPFNVGILRTKIATLLHNRALLRQRYANLELPEKRPDDDEGGCANCDSELDWQFIASVRKHVEEQMDNTDFNVDSLCTLMHMSRTSFYNKIKALTGQAPADYIRIIRLKRAVQLLRDPQFSVAEVADMTGFSDAKYFREVFRKYYKVSPSQYWKQQAAAEAEKEGEENGGRNEEKK